MAKLVTLQNDGTKGIIDSSTLGSGAIPTLQQVLDNNHDLENGNNFQGTNAGDQATGTNLIGLGDYANARSTGNFNVAIGDFAGEENSGAQNVLLGAGAGYQNVASHTFITGLNAGIGNVFNNVNILGQDGQADEESQTVFSNGNYNARLSYKNLNSNRKYELPDKSGIVALLDDTKPAFSTLCQSAVTKGTINPVVGGTLQRYNYNNGTSLYRFRPTSGLRTDKKFFEDEAMTIVYQVLAINI